MRRRVILLTIAGLAALAVAVGALAGTAEQSRPTVTTVRVTLNEFRVLPATHVVTQGKVKFIVRNAGRLMHEMVVIKTNKAAGSLPVSNREASEKGAVGEAPDVKPGKTKAVTLSLKAGKYVLICNIPGHYQQGQYTSFVVTK